ncbi:MAG: hypothetical protein IJD48_04400 [Clostridia bacterium]|nr:hypothetical protein [Clostridia bacterium]
MSQENKQVKNQNIKKQVSAVVLCLSVVLLILSTFEFVYPVKTLLLGCFGVMLYPILLFTMLFCCAILSGRKFIYSVKYVIYLLLCLVFFICVLHIIFTPFSSGLTYGEYLSSCFYSLYTPGGALIGIFTYPVTHLLHNVAGIVIYSIAFIISLYFVLSYLDAVKQNKVKKAEVNQARYQNFETISSALQEEENEDDSQIFEPAEEVEEYEEETQAEDDIFIKDDEDKEVLIAKEKLGLIKKQNEDDMDDNQQEQSTSNKLFGNIGVNNQSDSWQNRSISRDDRPQKYVYDNGENKPAKKVNPLYEKNKEYLNTLYQINTDNTNPIINAEDYEDYKEKMRLYNERNSQPFRRDLNVNQTLNVAPKEPVKTQNFDNNFGIEPDKRIQNIANNVSNFNNNNPFVKEEQNNIISSVNIQNNNLEAELEDISSSVGDIDGLSDFIKPLQSYKPSPLNPNNFSLSQDKIEEVKTENTSSQAFVSKVDDVPFKTSKLSEGDVSTSLGNTYNLPKSMKNNFATAEANGQITSTPAGPKFEYNHRYIRPSIDMLQTYVNEEDHATNHERNISILEKVLDEFKIPAKVEAVRRGSAVTRYELHMPVGIPVRKIHQHASDIALALAAPGEIRIETPIKGKSAVGIEIPNNKVDTVGLKDIIASEEFQNTKKPIPFALGKDVDGGIYCCDMASMPHLLVAGSTGSGKSVCLNSLLLSFIYRTSPEDLRLLLVDPKRVEFAIFNGLPHLLMPKAITEAKKALNAFDWLINEMERRYMLFQETYVKNIKEYNSQPEVVERRVPKLPYIVLVVDELADLVVTTNKKELEEKIIRLTQKARAAGIHLILATQRPSVDIITGSIKINLPSRIAFAVSSFVDSKTILDQAGAEKLLGRGDMLYAPSGSEPIRVQGAFVDTPEVKRVVDFVKENNPSVYDPMIEKFINAESGPVGGASVGASGGEEFDSLMPDALKLVIENNQASISMLQRRFSIGFSRAARIIDQMECAKFISSSDGSKPRNVYITMDDYNNIYGNN